MSQVIKKNKESIRKGIIEYFKRKQMPIVGDEVQEVIGRLEHCYDEMQIQKVRLSSTEESALFGLNPILLKRYIIASLQEKFDISYTQATIDYRNAQCLFEMSFINNDSIHYDILLEDTNELYNEAVQNKKYEVAEKLLARKESILKNKPKQIEAPVINRPKQIYAEWNVALLKVCNVIESQLDLIALENKMKDKLIQNTKTASNLLNSYAEDIDSE